MEVGSTTPTLSTFALDASDIKPSLRRPLADRSFEFLYNESLTDIPFEPPNMDWVNDFGTPLTPMVPLPPSPTLPIIYSHDVNEREYETKIITDSVTTGVNPAEITKPLAVIRAVPPIRPRSRFPPLLPSIRFTRIGYLEGLYCEPIFDCYWDGCPTQIRRNSFPDTDAGEQAFQMDVRVHIHEHSQKGVGKCRWAECLDTAELGEHRTIERHIRQRTAAWYHFCGDCCAQDPLGMSAGASARPCVKPGHSLQYRDVRKPKGEDVKRKEKRKATERVKKEKRARNGLVW